MALRQYNNYVVNLFLGISVTSTQLKSLVNVQPTSQLHLTQVLSLNQYLRCEGLRSQPPILICSPNLNFVVALYLFLEELTTNYESRSYEQSTLVVIVFFQFHESLQRISGAVPKERALDMANQALAEYYHQRLPFTAHSDYD